MAMSAFDRAKFADLPLFIQFQGIELRKKGKSFASYECPACGKAHRAGVVDTSSSKLSVFRSEDGIWRWKCFICRKSGTSIDFGSLVWGVSAIEAANRLAEGVMDSDIPQQEAEQPCSAPVQQGPALQRVLDLLLHHGHGAEPGVLAYLTKELGLKPEVVHEGFLRGIVRMLPSEPYQAVRFLRNHIGEGLLKDAGLWKHDSKWPAIAFRPLVFLLPMMTGAEFRLIREPKAQEPEAIRYGRLEWPWWWKGEDARRITIVDGAIDLLSLFAMGERGNIMGLPGVSSWRETWLPACSEKNPGAYWRLAINDDESDSRASAAILEQFRAANIEAERIYPRGKNWNAMLCSRPAVLRAA